MIANPSKFYSGVALMAAFLVVLVVMFLPVFSGQNALNFMDSLYNSISKGSAYYISDLKAEAEGRRGTSITVNLEMASDAQCDKTASLFEAAGASVEVDGGQLRINGDLGAILDRCLGDADEMFANKGEGIRARYGYEERRALYNWWTALKAMDRDLSRQSRFPEAAFVAKVNKKAVECAYNYYGIEPQRITEKIGVVLFSLIFYVLYTVWYGYAIIFMFEGWGLKLTH